MAPLKIECKTEDNTFLLTGEADEKGLYYIVTTTWENPIPNVVELDRATMLEISHYWKDLLDKEDLQ